jgi:glucosamine--fructose-6-phosphate aminotransferase (isomerizing)
MENELYDIPIQARLCYEKNKGLILPDKVPYIGMGSSYFAAVTLRYLGVKIFPELAGEYFHYIRTIKQFDNAVLISQSGRTTDVLNCVSCFKEYTALVNDTMSPLANQPNLKLVVPIYAGEELHSSTKTFINTLIALYLGHGFDVKVVLDSIERRFSEFELIGNSIGSELYKSIRKQKAKCVILGSGPNVGIACQAALMLSESLKYPFVGMSLTQYEHGYKETAEDAVVIVINPSRGILYERTNRLLNVLRNVNAKVFEVNESELDEIYSPLTSIIPFFFMADSLCAKLGVLEPFKIGSKVTERLDEASSTKDKSQ